MACCSETNTCNEIGGGGESCVITITFKARRADLATGAVEIIDNAVPAAQKTLLAEPVLDMFPTAYRAERKRKLAKTRVSRPLATGCTKGPFCKITLFCRTSWRGETTPASIRPHPFRHHLPKLRKQGCRLKRGSRPASRVALVEFSRSLGRFRIHLKRQTLRALSVRSELSRAP